MKNILVIDDEKIVVEVMQRMVSRLGYEVVATDSWKLGLKEFSEKKFDLVMLDVLMPGRNGFDIAQEMVQMRPDQKIIMITGCGSTSVYEHMFSIGLKVNDVLFKPFTFKKVMFVISDVMRKNEPIYA